MEILVPDAIVAAIEKGETDGLGDSTARKLRGWYGGRWGRDVRVWEGMEDERAGKREWWTGWGRISGRGRGVVGRLGRERGSTRSLWLLPWGVMWRGMRRMSSCPLRWGDRSSCCLAAEFHKRICRAVAIDMRSCLFQSPPVAMTRNPLPNHCSLCALLRCSTNSTSCLRLPPLLRSEVQGDDFEMSMPF